MTQAEETPVVLVMWQDSGMSFMQAWESEEDVLHRAREWNGLTATAGYLIYQDDERVVIAQNRDDETVGGVKWAGMFLIAKRSVVMIEPLIPMSASVGSSPLASAPATSSEGPPATAEQPTPQAVRPSEVAAMSSTDWLEYIGKEVDRGDLTPTEDPTSVFDSRDCGRPGYCGPDC